MNIIKQSDIPTLMARKIQPTIIQENFACNQFLNELTLIAIEVYEKERIAKQQGA